MAITACIRNPIHIERALTSGIEEILGVTLVANQTEKNNPHTINKEYVLEADIILTRETNSDLVCATPYLIDSKFIGLGG
jgi:hypothetical protein